ncbi:hypothetical protein CASFOL_030026 [Castilleja foliolosa]|uniref:Uncharacterized protein n=1 Tax=Castilleja foliolosa TaxID=1961234 RepID=A0ABD3CCN3_9LAMI
MPPSKTAMAINAMKKLGYSEKIVRPVVKELLKLYVYNWTLIEEDNYRVLVETILDSQEQKAHANQLKRSNFGSGNETEENEPIMKKTKRASPENQASSIRQMSRKNDIIYQRKRKSRCSPQPSRVAVKQKPEYTTISDDENDESDCWETAEPLPDDVALDEVPLAVIHPDPPTLLLQGTSNEDFSIYPEIIDLDTEDEEEILCQDEDQLTKDACGFEANHSEPFNNDNSESEKLELDDRDSTKLVVASSSLGEAKISLVFNPTSGSNFRVPTLEALLKKVERKCLSSYKIPQAGFSLLGLMQDVCECFLAAGSTSRKEPESEISLSGQSTLSNDLVFKFSPQIPMLFRPIRSDLSHHGMISLNLNLSGLSIVGKRHSYHYINDITKGYEACQVSLINEVNGEKGPKFSYIPKNVTYELAEIQLLSRVTGQYCCSDCFGDCLALVSPSCNCAGKNRGEFAYTPEGLLKEKLLNSFISISRSLPREDLLYCDQDCPLERSNRGELIGKCKGHVNREFIKECWYKCGCSMNCGNRVVQQGITTKLQVFMTSDGKGWGLRTLEDVPKGAFICEYVGEVVTIRELFERNVQKTSNGEMYPVLLDAGWSSKGLLKDDEALCLNATDYGNIARFINHRCFDANLIYIPVEVESPDRHYYHVAFFTTRKVKALEELTWDYGVEFGDRDSVKAFRCYCGSKMCRDGGL